MNVCMISGYASYSGGVENVVNEICRYLIEKNVDITVFGASKKDFVEKKPKFTLAGVHPYNIVPERLQIAFYPKIAFSLKTRQKINKTDAFDLIHGHADNCLFYALLRTKKPFVMTFHGTWAKSQERIVPQTMPVYCAEKIAAQRCDIAVACSNAVKNELTDFYGIEKQKIVTIHNGVDVNKFTPQTKAEARKRLNLPVDRKFVLWVGSAPQRKGLYTAIKAVKSLPNVTLLVVGSKGENLFNTVFLGRVSENELIAAYNAADMLVFPTVYEGFPVVPMEALSCGLPLVVSYESNMGEIISDGVHGFTIQQGSPEKYREKIQLILKDEVLINKMSSECRKLALKYSWSVQAQKYLDLYNKILS